MKLFTLQDAERSPDIDIKLVATRASQYRVFGSQERIALTDMAIADLRDGIEPDDFKEHYQVLSRHPMLEILLVRKLN